LDDESVSFERAIELRVRGPPADADPGTAGNYNFNIVHLERSYGRSPTCGFANNLCTILAPREMVNPHLLAWVE
jgi:hypothetical protein